MTSFKALLTKDFHTFKRQLYIPLWIILGMYIIMTVSLTLAYAKSGGNIVLAGIPIELLENSDLHGAISFALQAGILLGFFSIIFGIPMAVLSATLLNSDIKHKCELFHRSQPVSVWKNTASRFTAGIGGYVALAFLAGLVQLFIINILLTILTPMQANWWLAFNGFLLSWLHLSISLIVLGSMAFLLSAIFRDNAIGKGALAIAAVDISVVIINYFLKMDIPSLSLKLIKLVYSNISAFSNVFPTLQYGIVVGKNNYTTGDASSFVLPQGFLSSLYASVFTWETLAKAGLCVALYALATFIYKKREVQF